MARLIFIGGGARSGKSAAAVARAKSFSPPRVFLATAAPSDEEMRTRIALHKKERGLRFETMEVPLELAAAIEGRGDASVIVIDCLTLWLSNLLFEQRTDEEIMHATEAWIEAAQQHPGTVVVVANEVGQGLVPMDALSRRFRDAAGRVNQRVAAAAHEVELRYFGLGLTLKNDASLGEEL